MTYMSDQIAVSMFLRRPSTNLEEELVAIVE